jgi:CRP/FNR family transcriptional regulator, anaerobic regulatory protein
MGKKLTNNIAVPVEIAASSCLARSKVKQIQYLDALTMSLAIPTTCSHCHLRQLCMPLGLSAAELAHIDLWAAQRHQVAKGRELYFAGDAFRNLYAVRSGFFKTVVSNAAGHEQISSFLMAGEILGLDGMGTQRHMCDALALEDSEVCVLPEAQIEALSAQVPSLQQHLRQLMSREIVRDQNVMLLLGSLRAHERVAAFVLNLSQRLQLRGFSAHELVLRMSREEIASYLGLTLETVSRSFSQLASQGVLQVQHKQVSILQPQTLAQIAQGSDEPHATACMHT